MFGCLGFGCWIFNQFRCLIVICFSHYAISSQSVSSWCTRPTYFFSQNVRIDPFHSFCFYFTLNTPIHFSIYSFQYLSSPKSSKVKRIGSHYHPINGLQLSRDFFSYVTPNSQNVSYDVHHFEAIRMIHIFYFHHHSISLSLYISSEYISDLYLIVFFCIFFNFYSNRFSIIPFQRPQTANGRR